MKEKLVIAGCVIALSIGAWQVFNSNLIAGGSVLSGRRMLNVDTDYRFGTEIGLDFKGWPMKSPDTGKMTAYPAEACYWYDCGKVQNGTWVVLNSTLGKQGPTLCPKCDHVVTGHNPLPPHTYVDKDGYLQQRTDIGSPSAGGSPNSRDADRP